VERSIAMVVGFLAILKAGGAYLPLDVGDPARRVESMLKDSGAQFLLTQSGLPTSWKDFCGAVIVLNAEGRPPSEAASPARPPAPARTADDVAYVIYTSGSTGQPKGICVKHRGITRLVLGTNFIQMGRGERIAQASNASFDAATFEIWGALLNGGCLVGIPREVTLAPLDLAAALRQQGINVLFLTTALFNQLVRQVPDIFSSLHYLLFGGEAVSPRWVRTALEHGRPRHLLHVYGPTECTTFSTWHEVDQVPADADSIPIGRPIANSTAYVLDRGLQPVPAGTPGELFLGGDGLATGYLGRPDLTAERFIPHPFSSAPGARLYRTGDLVRQRSNGDLVFLGRLDDQVKIDGHRIEPAEIEHVLRTLDGVQDCRVLVRTGPAGQRRLAAYLVISAATAQDAIRSALAERLPPYMVPHFFFFLSALPITPNGKLDQAALPDPFAPAVADGARPQTAELDLVIAAWTEVLGRRPAAEDLNFFDAGGTSLEAVQLHDVLSRRSGRSLAPAFIFEHATIRRQAEALSAGSSPLAAAPGGRGQQRRNAQSEQRRRRTP
jgi:amino acid adenylation domain-containing protein